MPRPKLRVRQYQVAVNKEQQEALEKLMQEDLQTNVSQYFGMMIAEVTQWREDYKTKRAGRPKKEEENQVVWYKAPDGSRTAYTIEDLENYYAFRNLPMPDKLPDVYDPSEL